MAPIGILLLLRPDIARWDDPSFDVAAGLRKLACTAIYTNVITVALAATYNLGLARLPLHRLARPMRRFIYVTTVPAVVIPCTLAIVPLLSAVHHEMVSVPFRLVVQGILLSYLWLGAYATYDRLLARIRKERDLAHEERLAAQDARLRLLQARTNPHFLYNSLNSVMSLIPTDPELAEETLGRLAALFRYALESSTRLAVPLVDEVACANDYLSIETIRFRERLRYSVDVDPSLRAIQVPPMLLQPLVENAVKHGIGGRVRGGSVTVRAELAGEDLLLSVLDDGPGPTPAIRPGTGTSLADLRERLRLLYGEDGRLVAEPAPEGGFVAQLRLPVVRPS
ncbi:sensor histidine kinase [Sorangium cellulosum]|uniref:sensor histidine kinase n=1 Tax=Sorangium cellulosum TaxID=56 RepID=UPI0013311DAF|nr:histidine kinase [Sorangium cellulosum]